MPDVARITLSFAINGEARGVVVAPCATLLDVLRDGLRLTGAKKGCDMGACGACTVLADGRRIKSCLALAASYEGQEITTIEGLANGTLHPMQEAFRENHGLQCGFCTPGMIMSAIDLVKNNPDPSDDEIRHWLEGNLCRCTGYHNIVKSVIAGAAAMRDAK